MPVDRLRLLSARARPHGRDQRYQDAHRAASRHQLADSLGGPDRDGDIPGGGSPTIGDYQRRDRLLAAQAPAILLGQLAVWLGISFVGYWLLLWPFVTGGITVAFVAAGSALFTLGFAEPPGTAPAVIVFAAAATGLAILTLQIAYLPTLYAAFNRRETEVALLNARAGVPSWGPELLARTHYGLGSGVSTIDTLPDLYTRWNAGRRTSRKATRHTCPWCGSGRRARCRRG